MVLPVDKEDVGDVIKKMILEIGLDKLSSRAIREKLSEVCLFGKLFLSNFDQFLHILKTCFQTFKIQFGKEHKNEIDAITKLKIEEIRPPKSKSVEKESSVEREKSIEKAPESPPQPLSPESSIKSEETTLNYVTEKATFKVSFEKIN